MEMFRWRKDKVIMSSIMKHNLIHTHTQTENCQSLLIRWHKLQLTEDSCVTRDIKVHITAARQLIGVGSVNASGLVLTSANKQTQSASPLSIPSSQSCLCSSTSTMCDSWGWGLGSLWAWLEGWGEWSVVGCGQTPGHKLALLQSLGKTLDPWNTQQGWSIKLLWLGKKTQLVAISVENPVLFTFT